MRLSPTLSLYLGRQFLLWCGVVFVALAGLLLLFDVIELVRRTAPRPDATFAVAIEMALLKLSDTRRNACPLPCCSAPCFRSGDSTAATNS